MKTENVIKILKPIANIFTDDRRVTHGKIENAFDIAFKALEKQIAKKVNNRKLLRYFNGRPYSIRGDCPICGSKDLLSSNTDYCNVCGQKLDWGEG